MASGAPHFLIRSVRESDLDELYRLSKFVFFLNLPSDREILKKKNCPFPGLVWWCTGRQICARICLCPGRPSRTKTPRQFAYYFAAWKPLISPYVFRTEGST